jgi:membrane protease YdiL (CAAX protease family)
VIPALQEAAAGTIQGPSPATGAVLLATAAGSVPLAIALAGRLVPHREVFFARWGFSHVLAAAGVGLLVAALCSLLGATDPGAERGFLGVLWATVAIQLAVALFVVHVTRRVQPEGPRALGFGRGRNLRAIALGLGSLLLLFPAFFGVAILWAWLAPRLGIEPVQEVVTGIVELEGLERAQAVLIAVVVAPFLEETVFRGFLQPLLVQNLREKGGIAVTSLVFALLHGTAALVPIFALSCLLGTIHLRTRRLPAVWVVHGVFNAIMLAMVFAFPELAEAPQ